MQMNLKPNSRLAKAGTLFFDYLVISPEQFFTAYR